MPHHNLSWSTHLPLEASDNPLRAQSIIVN